MVQWKLPTSKPLLSSLCITSVKISEFALVIFIERSDATCEGRGFKGQKLLKGCMEAVECTLVLPTCTEDVCEILSSKYLA